jgi:hypothetical protein
MAVILVWFLGPGYSVMLNISVSGDFAQEFVETQVFPHLVTRILVSASGDFTGSPGLVMPESFKKEIQ